MPVKSIAKEIIPVAATITIEGHETLTAEVCLFNAKDKLVDCTPLIQSWPGTDRYEGSFTVPETGDYYFIIITLSPIEQATLDAMLPDLCAQAKKGVDYVKSVY